MSKSCVDVIKIKESMVINDQKSKYNRCHQTKNADILELETNNSLLSQSKLLNAIVK